MAGWGRVTARLRHSREPPLQVHMRLGTLEKDTFLLLEFYEEGHPRDCAIFVITFGSHHWFQRLAYVVVD